MTAKTEFVEKTEYTEKLEAQLDYMEAEMDALEAKARMAKADVTTELRKNVSSLRERWKDAKERVYKMRNTAGEAWGDLKDGTDDALESLANALRQAQQRFE